MIGSDAAVLAIAGLGAGAVIGWVLSRLLVSVLNGVFDPPPTSMAIPWQYLATLTIATVIALAAVTAAGARAASTPAITTVIFRSGLHKRPRGGAGLQASSDAGCQKSSAIRCT